MPQIPHAVKQRWEIVPVSYLGGRLNRHWLVEYGHSQLVVRGYSDEAFPHIAYELEILAGLNEAGWPVPAAIEEPIQVDGRIWGLFKFLPGTYRATNRPEDRRTEVFDRLDLDGAATTVLHGDFAPWNLLYESERLSGILDFEATHLNYRVADFANSWRGYQDEVIEGYETVSKLSDLERELLAPAYWAWMFIGVKQAIETALAENDAPPDFEWQVRHLLRREGLMSRLVDPYPVTVHSPA